jgi:hypothetical protein
MDEAQNVNADGQQAVVEAQTQTQPIDPAWLNDRLARAKETARKELAQEYGADPEQVKAALKLAKELQDAKLSETEKLTAELTELRGVKAKAEALEVVVKANAEQALAALDEKGRAFVASAAGQDPAAQLKMINELRASGLLAPKAEPVPVAANTAPAAPAPKVVMTPKESILQQYAALKADPYRTSEKAFFLLQHVKDHPELLNEP